MPETTIKPSTPFSTRTRKFIPRASTVVVCLGALILAYAGKRYFSARDTTSPTAAITSPASSATVAGSLNVSVTASDNVGVTKVELYVNGALLATSTSAITSFAVDTATLSNGSATLSAIAYDKAGNKGSAAPVTVTVDNLAQASAVSSSASSSSTTDTSALSLSNTSVGTSSPLGACLPSGAGHDYQVGPNAGQLAALDLVPWDKLVAGDTVRIFYSATPYRGKFMLSGNGTAVAPIRVCGVKGSNGERPIIDGQNATTRSGLAYGNLLHETRSIIVVKPLSTATWTAFPSYIQIDGLEIRGAVAANTFTDSTGTVRNYTYDPSTTNVNNFGACIWLDRGQNITIADNVIHDCTNGIFSKSTNDGDFAVTKNILISGNYIYGNGVSGDVHQHNTYTESVNITYEFNRFEALRSGALGNAIKDRSAGTVIRYNYVSGGAHAMDLVEAEDFYTYLASVPAYLTAYRSTFVYGNIIVKDGATGSAIHYGGDHYGSTPGASWGEPLFRKGTLYFYSNTVSISGTSGQLFQISTTEETAEIWNNLLHLASTVVYPSLRATSEVNTTYWNAGGNVNLGRNWASSALTDSDPWHTVPGGVTGWANLIRGTTLPTDNSFVPLSGSAIVDAAQADLSAVTSYPIQYQMNTTTFTGQARAIAGTSSDIGAMERVTN